MECEEEGKRRPPLQPKRNGDQGRRLPPKKPAMKMQRCKFKFCPYSSRTSYGLHVHSRSCVFNQVIQRQIDAATREDREIFAASSSQFGRRPSGPQQRREGHRLASDEELFRSAEEFLQTQEDLTEAAELDRMAVHNAAVHRECQRDEAERLKKLEKSKAAVQCVGIMLSELAEKSSSQSIENLIKGLSDPNFSVDIFRDSCRTVQHCHNIASREFESSISKRGYSKHEVALAEGPSYIMYARDRVQVLREQIRNAASEDVIFDPVEQFNEEGEKGFSHPMGAEVALNGVQAVRRVIQKSTDPNVIWWTQERNGGLVLESFVGLGQLYSDKSQTSLKAGAFKFCPVHVTLLNFTEDFKRMCIVKGHTVVGYLPVTLDTEHYEDEQKRMHPVQMHALHDALPRMFTSLISAGEKGFPCEAKDGVPRVCHFAVGSYCCDIQEVKNLTSVKCNMACHRCYTPHAEFNRPVNHGLRELRHTLEAQKESRLQKSECDRERAIEKRANQQRAYKLDTMSTKILDDLHITSQEPFLSRLPFVPVHPSFEMYSLFCFEPLHNFYIGLSRTVKQSASDRLKSVNLRSTVLRTKKGQPLSFSSIRTRVLNEANLLLRRIDQESPVKGMRVDFSVPGAGVEGNGLFTKDGVLGMLEAKDMKSIEMVAPFIGALIDRCCGEVRDAPTTTVFAQYSNIVRISMRYGAEVFWTEDVLQRLERAISEFKFNAVQLYRKHQASAMGTLKFHMLEHLVADIRRLGGIQFGHAGLWEYSHTLFKEMYKTTSKRLGTALPETISAIERRMARKAFRQNSEMWANEQDRSSTRRSVWKSKKEALRNDCGSLVREGVRVQVNDILNACMWQTRMYIAMRKNEKLTSQRFQDMYNNLPASVLEIWRGLGFAALQNLLQEMLNSGDIAGFSSLHEMSIIKVKSGFIAGHQTPDALLYTAGKRSVRFRDGPRRFSQRVVVFEAYYGRKSYRQDCVMIEGTDGGGNIECWFAKALLLFRIDNTVQGGNSKANEFAFVQFFDVLRLVHGVDTALGCVKLRYARKQSTGVERGMVKWFEIVPISTLRGVVQLIPMACKLLPIDPSDQDKQNWELETFYVNRFLRESEDQRFDVSDEGEGSLQRASSF